MSVSDERVEAVAREIAVYLTKRRDILDVVLAGNAELGRTMMLDLARRVAALDHITEEKRDEPSEALAAAHREALSLANALHRRWYPEVTQWRPLDDVAGIISQIDNMTAGLGMRLNEAETELAAMRAAYFCLSKEDK